MKLDNMFEQHEYVHFEFLAIIINIFDNSKTYLSYWKFQKYILMLTISINYILTEFHG
jgi:hypothetical protein